VGVGKVRRYSFWWNSEYVPGPAMFSRDMARKSQFFPDAAPDAVPEALRGVLVVTAVCEMLASACAGADAACAEAAAGWALFCCKARSFDVCASLGIHLIVRTAMEKNSIEPTPVPRV
jgi:hypothetical protein